MRLKKSYISFFTGMFLFLFFLFINPFQLDVKACKVLAVGVLMITWWISEALPMPAVALIPIVLFPLLKIETISATTAPYANEVVFLFMGGFMIGLGIEKWNLHKRIALSIVRFTGTSGNRIILGFILSTGFISMWLSNTATTMMMFPIALSVISVISEGKMHEKGYRNFAMSLMLTIAYASNFGGIATIIGTPPNVAYVAYISKKFNYEIPFANWAIVCFPIALILLFSLYFVLTRILFPNKIASNLDMQNVISGELQELGSITVPEKRVMAIFGITALLWIFRDLINQLGVVKLDDNMIAIAGALLMFIVPSGNLKENEEPQMILDWHDTKKMAWGILLLFGGGITLANAMEKAGLMEMLGNWIASFSGTNTFVLVLVITTISIFISEVMSNIAQVIVFAPVVTGIGIAVGINPLILGVAMTLASSCASMMPMGTPPNAIAFASGHIKIKEMIKAGFVMNIISIVLIVFFCYKILPLVVEFVTAVH
ncbi:MAG: SLC13 family permease [Chitinophagaceae bacterium]